MKRTLWRLPLFPAPPRIRDSWKDERGYAVEMFFFTIVDCVSYKRFKAEKGQFIPDTQSCLRISKSRDD